jgi:hypothetical protein
MACSFAALSVYFPTMDPCTDAASSSGMGKIGADQRKERKERKEKSHHREHGEHRERAAKLVFEELPGGF